MRRILGGMAGAATAALGAVVLGEYPFSGLVVLGAAALLGLFVAGAVTGVGRWRGRLPAGLAAVLAAAGMTWAAWISEGHDLGRLPIEGWLAVFVAMATAAVREWRPGSASDSPTGPAPRR